jgi:hypothetical protein
MDDPWHEFEVAIARWRLGDLPSEGLPAAALGALSGGCDGASLGRLAGMGRAGWSEIEPLIARAYQERGVELPDERTAVKLLADATATRIVRGAVDPLEGADALHRLAWRCDGEARFEDLNPFIGLWGELDVAEAGIIDIEELRAAVVREAQELLDRGGVR